MPKYIELIDKYLIKQETGDYNPPSYIWTDNTGEIIRCKDCKHYAEFRVKIQNVEQRTGWCERELNYFNVEPEDFCSKGERKDESA